MLDTYLKSAIQQFEYYKILGEKTFEQLSTENLFWKYNKESNSIANTVQHLSGNMVSRFTNFLTTDGEKEWRNRDVEFEDSLTPKQELLDNWNTGWACLLNTLKDLKQEDLSKEIYIRNQGHSVVEAINRQLCHYAYHVGQIVFIGKMICDKKWDSLSIAKGNSKGYNAERFLKPKHNEHFTAEYLRNKK
jgi:hypothetical protein